MCAQYDRCKAVRQMSDLGYDSVFGPGCVCSNIAQGVAALVVALRTKSTKDRQISVSGGITALMGITDRKSVV